MKQFLNKTRLLQAALLVTFLAIEGCGPLRGSISEGTIICSDYHTDNISTLDVDLVHTMVNNYRGKQLKSIQNPTVVNPVLQDAHSIWFDLETLKKFLYHIENTSKSQDPNITDANLGIRIYYAAYPEKLNEEVAKRFDDLSNMVNDPVMQNYSGLHTLIMIPTIEIKGQMFDFNPNDGNTYATGIIGNDNYIYNANSPIPNTTTIPALSGTSSNSRNTGARNHGSLIPPATLVPVEGF
jgi:hypothetical protein